jgi:hypothetical protein
VLNEALHVTIAPLLIHSTVQSRETLPVTTHRTLHAMSESSSPAHVPDGQPNPVLVGPGMKALRDEAYSKATNATPSLDTDKTHPVDSDAPSYFAGIPGTRTESMDSSDLATSGAESRRKTSAGEDLLRRLSLTGPASPMSPGIDPREEHPGLRLSGRVISAAFCIPYKLYFKAGSDWVSTSIFLLCIYRSQLLTNHLVFTDRETPVWHLGFIRLLCSSGIR